MAAATVAAATAVPLHMQYYQQHVLGAPKPATAAAGKPPAGVPKRPPAVPTPYTAPNENTLVAQCESARAPPAAAAPLTAALLLTAAAAADLRTKVAAPPKKPPAKPPDDMRRFYAPISDPREISKHASHYVKQPRGKVPLTVQYYLDHVMKVPPPKPAAPPATSYKDPSLGLVEQYKMRQGQMLQKAMGPAKAPAALPGSYGLTLEGSYALHSLQKAASMAWTAGPSAAVQSMDGFAARLKSTEPVVTLGEAQRLLAHLARCLNDVVAPPPDGKWPEEQRATMRYYFTAVLEELEGALLVTPLRRAREHNQQAQVNAMLVEEIPQHARQYGTPPGPALSISRYADERALGAGLDVLARLKTAHKYPAMGPGSWPAAKTPVETMPPTGPPTCPRSPAACVMPRAPRTLRACGFRRQRNSDGVVVVCRRGEPGGAAQRHADEPRRHPEAHPHRTKHTLPPAAPPQINAEALLQVTKPSKEATISDAEVRARQSSGDKGGKQTVLTRGSFFCSGGGSDQRHDQLHKRAEEEGPVNKML